jgi:hypothetical protein
MASSSAASKTIRTQGLGDYRVLFTLQGDTMPTTEQVGRSVLQERAIMML